VRFGEPADSSLRHRKLGAARRVIFGAPGYFARHGRPRTPQDLRRHDCIVRSGVRAADTWRFIGKRGPLAVKVKGRFRADGAAACCEAAAAGLGIARAPLYQIRTLLDQGRVELVLEDAPQALVPIHVLWPAGTVLPARTRALIDFLAARLSVERI
jgi:DNA-binding transcriptional LysR family regulator